MAFDLTAVLRLNSSQFDRGMRSARNSLGGLKTGAGEVIKQLGLITGTAAAVGVAFSGIKKTMDFESELSTIKALTGASNEEMAKMQKLALDMGAKTKYNAMEAAQGIEELLKAGLTPATVQAGGLEAALNLATAGGLGLADAAEIMSTALNSFKDDGMKAAQAADILAGTANASATDVMDLKYSLSMVSAVASGVGMSFKDTNTALGLLANNGLKGSDAGTSLKTMLLNLSPKTKEAADTMASLGLSTKNVGSAFNWLSDRGMRPASKSTKDVISALQRLAKAQAGPKASASKIAKEYDKLAKYSGFASSAFYDQEGKLKSLDQIAGLLHKSLKDLNNEQRQQALATMFGTDAIRASNILYKEGAKGAQDFAKEMSKVTALDVAREKMNNAAGAVEQFKGALETLQISVLLPLMPVIKDAANSLANWIENLKPDQIKQFGDTIKDAFSTGLTWAKNIFNFINDNWPVLKEVIIAVTTAVLAYKAAMVGLSIVAGITNLIMGLIKVYGLLTGAQWALNVAMDANPIGAIIALIALLTAAGVLLYRNWDKVKAVWTVVWNTMKVAAETSINFVIGRINALIKLINKIPGVNIPLVPKVDFTPVNKYLQKAQGGKGGSASGSVGMKQQQLSGFAGGLDYVPYDGFVARLHKGERVLTKDEARRGAGGGNGVVITGNTFHVRQESDIHDIAYELAEIIKREGVQM